MQSDCKAIGYQCTVRNRCTVFECFHQYAAKHNEQDPALLLRWCFLQRSYELLQQRPWTQSLGGFLQVTAFRCQGQHMSVPSTTRRMLSP